jgi:hypothetical protein
MGLKQRSPRRGANYPEQIRKLLGFLDSLEADGNDQGKQHVALRLETKLIRGKDATAAEFRWTDDPKAPATSAKQKRQPKSQETPAPC